MYLADKVYKYTGVDITPGNIDLLNKKIKDKGLKNVESLPIMQ